FQVAAGLFRADVVGFVVGDGAERPHGELGDLRKVVDDALGDTVAEVFGIGVGAHIHERQDGEGIERGFPEYEVGSSRGCNRDGAERKKGGAPVTFEARNEIFGAGRRDARLTGGAVSDGSAGNGGAGCGGGGSGSAGRRPVGYYGSGCKRRLRGSRHQASRG